MLNNIFLKFSEYALLRDGEHPFSNKYSATAEAILTEFTTNEDIVNSSVEDLVAFINTKSRGRIAEPEETAKIVQAAARNSYRLDKCLYEPLTISIASSSYNKFVSKKKAYRVILFLIRQMDTSKHLFRRFFFTNAGSSFLCLLVNKLLYSHAPRCYT